ncbi:hypothetical protein BDQ12DRAFT_364949 [Crucibulum laeve]|uniref:Uncharacterized protein n=1 Tax=Crucibulum laeve TaxID=68775 RepID=A0A5C3M0Q4_9AGAR|nr:hypothetical protein BDQ12DRAFT_364949 [Crucibulum laeve]
MADINTKASTELESITSPLDTFVISLVMSFANSPTTQNASYEPATPKERGMLFKSNTKSVWSTPNLSPMVQTVFAPAPVMHRVDPNCQQTPTARSYPGSPSALLGFTQMPDSFFLSVPAASSSSANRVIVVNAPEIPDLASEDPYKRSSRCAASRWLSRAQLEAVRNRRWSQKVSPYSPGPTGKDYSTHTQGRKAERREQRESQARCRKDIRRRSPHSTTSSESNVHWPSSTGAH